MRRRAARRPLARLAGASTSELASMRGRGSEGWAGGRGPRRWVPRDGGAPPSTVLGSANQLGVVAWDSEVIAMCGAQRCLCALDGDPPACVPFQRPSSSVRTSPAPRSSDRLAQVAAASRWLITACMSSSSSRRPARPARPALPGRADQRRAQRLGLEQPGHRLAHAIAELEHRRENLLDRPRQPAAAARCPDATCDSPRAP